MCAGDDRNCPDFELHHRNFKETLDRERRSFLRSSFAAAGGAAAMTAGGISLVTPQMAAAAEKNQPAKRSYHHLPANAETVHWGYFSKKLKPQVEIDSGDFVTIETLTHHANDDSERMMNGDPGAESVFHWTKERRTSNRRGAGPIDASIHGRGAGEGFGVHICTGPIFVRGAEPGRRARSAHPRRHAAALRQSGLSRQAFGSNAAAWWGFHYNDLLTEPKPREVITIYEIDATAGTQLGERGLQLPLGAADRPVRRGAQDHRLSRRSGRSCAGRGKPRHPRRTCASRSGRISACSPRAEGGRHRRFRAAELFRRQRRQLADRQGRDDVLPGRGRARCSRRATRTPARAIPNCAAPRSSVR